MIAEMKAASKRLTVPGDHEGHSIQADTAWVGQGHDAYLRLYLTVKAVNMDGEDQTVVIALNRADIWQLVSNIAMCIAEVG